MLPRGPRLLEPVLIDTPRRGAASDGLIENGNADIVVRRSGLLSIRPPSPGGNDKEQG